MWIFAAKLPNSDLNFALDFLVYFPPVFPRKKTPKTLLQKIPRKIHPGICSEKNPLAFCRSLPLRNFRNSSGSSSETQILSLGNAKKKRNSKFPQHRVFFCSQWVRVTQSMSNMSTCRLVLAVLLLESPPCQ